MGVLKSTIGMGVALIGVAVMLAGYGVKLWPHTSYLAPKLLPLGADMEFIGFTLVIGGLLGWALMTAMRMFGLHRL